MSVQFTKATKRKARARIAFAGPPGSGKTWTGLLFASVLGDKVAVIDTERGSASKYADAFQFDTIELTTFEAEKYIEGIEAASAAGYDVLVIDSLSHAWAGKGGMLERVDNIAARSQSKNSYTAWRDATPVQNRLIDTILQAPMHIIATMRTKTEYVIEDDSRGKKVPRKVGLAPVQRDGVEYEFDVVGDMDPENRLIVSKTRCPALTGLVIEKPGKAVAETIKAWLTDGAEVPAVASGVLPGAPGVLPRAPAASAPSATSNGNSKDQKRMWAMIREHDVPVEETEDGTFVIFGDKRFRPKMLSDDQVHKFIDAMRAEFEGV